jgi:putative aldouronate transport system permease protein
MIRDNSFSTKVLGVVTHVIIACVLLVTLVPFIHIIAISFSDPKDIAAGNVSLWPVNFTTLSYEMIFSNIKIPRAFLNSVMITSMGTVINLIFTTLTAYALSKRELPFRSFFLKFMMFTMFFSGGIIPKFLLVNSMGMYDTFWALTIPSAINVFFMIIMLSFFKNFPKEIEESAKMDGCNDFQILWKIVIPLSMAPVMTIAMFYAVQHWNSYFQALMFMTSGEKFPLQLVLRQIVLENQVSELGSTMDYQGGVNSESLKYGTLVLSILPMIIIYPFVQKYFVRGVMIGSLKE